MLQCRNQAARGGRRSRRGSSGDEMHDRERREGEKESREEVREILPHIGKVASEVRWEVLSTPLHPLLLPRSSRLSVLTSCYFPRSALVYPSYLSSQPRPPLAILVSKSSPRPPHHSPSHLPSPPRRQQPLETRPCLTVYLIRLLVRVRRSTIDKPQRASEKVVSIPVRPG